MKALGVKPPRGWILSDQVEHYRRALIEVKEEAKRIRTGIAKHAEDTIWCGEAETACDALDALAKDAGISAGKEVGK